MGIFDIPDEFEVEYATQYSASYNDDIMSGSMFSSDHRTREGSHASGSNWVFKAGQDQRQVLFSEFFDHQSKYNVGYSYKFNVSVCPNETLADCVLPDMISLALNNGAKRVYNITEGGAPFNSLLNMKIVLGYADLFVTGIVDNAQISDNTWLQTFPFEYRYQTIVRKPGLQTFSVVTDYDEHEAFLGNNNWDIYYQSDYYPIGSSPNQFALEFLVDASSSFVFKSSPNVAANSPGDWSNIQHRTVTDFHGQVKATTQLLYTTSAFHYAVPQTLHKHFFGFGAGYRGQVEFQRVTSSADSSAKPSYLHGQGALLRGWKYGIANGLPTTTRAVWRRGKYGQFRDMLEQRQFTKYYDTIGLKLDGTMGGAVGLKNAVIEIRFISGSNAWVTASMSASLNPNNSGIYDFEYKSGRPFFDT